MKNALLLAAVMFSAGCRPAAQVSPHTPVGANASALRDAFNAESEKTRLIALVSPS